MQRCLKTLVALALLTESFSWIEWARRMPNGLEIPLLNGGYCKAVGHPKCSPYTDAGLNQLGEDMEDLGETWTDRFCRQDSDGDGLTNGDELGDPCCIWQPPLDGSVSSDKPRRTNPDLSDPSDPFFRLPIASCRLDGPPPAVNNTTWRVSQNKVELSFTQSTGCVCAHRVVVLLRNGSTSTLGTFSPHVNEFSICGVSNAGDIVSLRVDAENLAGSQAGTDSTQPLATSVSATCISEYAPTPTGEPPEPTGKQSTKLPEFDLIASWACIVAFAIVGFLFNLSCAHKALPVRVFHNTKCLPAAPGPKLMHWVGWNVWSWVTSAEVVAWGILALAMTLIFGFYVRFYEAEPGELPRAFGNLTQLALCLTLIPVTRTSFITYLTGVPFERLVRVHRWIAFALIVLCTVHGFGMWLEYDAMGGAGSRTGNTGAEICLAWGPEDPKSPLRNNLAGFLTWVCWTAMLLLSLEPVRRVMWEVFLIGHLVLFPCSLVFAFLHTKSALRPFLIPVILYGVDTAMRVFRVLCVSSSVTTFRALGSDIVEIVVELRAKGWLVADIHAPMLGLTPLATKPGQWANVWIPSVGVFPHPITIATFTRHPPAHDAPPSGSMVFYIKCEGHARSWSRKLHALASQGESVAVYVEGSYGVAQVEPEHAAGSLLVAGGVGITPMLSFYADLVRRPPQTPRRVVRLLWSVRDPGLKNAVLDILKGLPQVEGCSALICFTGKPAPPPDIGESVHNGVGGDGNPVWNFQPVPANQASSQQIATVSVQERPGRPDLHAEIEAVVEQVKPQLVLLCGCGPAALVDSAQKTAKSFGTSVAVHTETFAW